MPSTSLNRREFATVFTAAVGAAVAAPALAQHTARPETGTYIQLDSNENPYGPSPAACAAITASENIACRYPDVNDEAMVAKLAAFYQLPHNQIVLGTGSTEILQMADQAFVGPGRSAIAAEPTFETVLGYAKVMQANPIKVPVTADFRTDLNAMAAAITPQSGLIYICNPNNPTGTIVSLKELAAFMPRVPAHVKVLVDEAYFDFVTDPGYGTVAPWIARYPNLFIARTFSKVYGMAGMRLGYAVGAPETMAELGRFKTPMNANVAVLRAGLASFGDSAHVADQRRLMISTREWLCAELDKDHRRYVPSHANFMMIDLGTDVGPVVAAFRERNILVGRRFPAMANWMRITIGKPQEMQAFMTGLRAIVPAAAA